MYNDPYVSDKHMSYLDKLNSYYKWIISDEIAHLCYKNLYEIYSSYNKSFPIELNLVEWIDLTIESILSYMESNDNELKLDALYYIKQIEDIINEFADHNKFKKILNFIFPIWKNIIENWSFWHKKSIEELISDRDFSWIVNYCKNGTLMGSSQEVASGLYNIANQVWQYYNDNELAIKLYKESIKYNEKDPTVYNNLATAYKRLEDYENSILYYNKSLNLDSYNPIRYLRPAFLYAYIWKKAEAISLLKKYFEIWWDDLSFIELSKNTTQWWDDLLKLYNTF